MITKPMQTFNQCPAWFVQDSPFRAAVVRFLTAFVVCRAAILPLRTVALGLDLTARPARESLRANIKSIDTALRARAMRDRANRAHGVRTARRSSPTIGAIH
jgi:hypothetical protein